MGLDLESLRAEMQAYLDDSGLAVFHGYHHSTEDAVQFSWDTERHPDFREFLSAGQKSGVKLFVFHHESFSLDRLDDVLEQLQEADLTREEKRSYEARLRQLQAYDGFTCSVELSFSLEGRDYVFEAHADWYQSLNDIMFELDVSFQEEEDEDGGDSMGRFFSKN
ncbi:MAG TPA: hypothetical protein VHU83_10650 [Bryobacteraceae bacterium]|nr:hypothetical protein [Bryobacteraceae bacterium]